MSQTQTPALRVQAGESIPDPTSTTRYPGDVALLGQIPLVVAPNDPNNVGNNTLEATGIYDVPKDASIFGAGDPVFWNPTGSPNQGTASTGAATSTGTANYYMGVATQAQLTGDNYVRTRLQSFTPGGSNVYSVGVTASDSVTNTNAETAFVTTATIPANTLDAGDVVHVRAVGEVTGQNSTNTHNVKLKILTSANTYTTIVQTGATNAAANTVWYADVDLIFTAVGNATTGYLNGVGLEGIGAAPAPFVFANTAINTLEAIVIEVTSTASAASAGNVDQLLELDVSKKAR